MNASVLSLSAESVYLRLVHVTLAACTLLFASLYGDQWTQKKTAIMFIIVYVPFYYLSWTFNLDEFVIREGTPVSFRNFWYHFFALAIFVPGPFVINFIMMCGFVIEMIALWFYLKTPAAPDVILLTEPFDSFLFAVVAFALLGHRYREDRIIHTLYLKQSKAAVLEDLTKIFLSIRDKANTPLQTLRISVDLLKKKNPQPEETILVMERAVERLTGLSEILNKSSSIMAHDETNLMKDEEISNWFNELMTQEKRERKATKSKTP
jgi:hypothetical protein